MSRFPHRQVRSCNNDYILKTPPSVAFTSTKRIFSVDPERIGYSNLVNFPLNSKHCKNLISSALTTQNQAFASILSMNAVDKVAKKGQTLQFKLEYEFQVRVDLGEDPLYCICSLSTSFKFEWLLEKSSYCRLVLKLLRSRTVFSFTFALELKS
jgi:hypothetical protein